MTNNIPRQLFKLLWLFHELYWFTVDEPYVDAFASMHWKEFAKHYAFRVQHNVHLLIKHTIDLKLSISFLIATKEFLSSLVAINDSISWSHIIDYRIVLLIFVKLTILGYTFIKVKCIFNLLDAVSTYKQRMCFYFFNNWRLFNAYIFIKHDHILSFYITRIHNLFNSSHWRTL